MLNGAFVDLSALLLAYSDEPIFNWCVRAKCLKVRVCLPHDLNQSEVKKVGARCISVDEDAAAERVSRLCRGARFC